MCGRGRGKVCLILEMQSSPSSSYRAAAAVAAAAAAAADLEFAERNFRQSLNCFCNTLEMKREYEYEKWEHMRNKNQRNIYIFLLKI